MGVNYMCEIHGFTVRLKLGDAVRVVQVAREPSTQSVPPALWRVIVILLSPSIRDLSQEPL